MSSNAKIYIIGPWNEKNIDLFKNGLKHYSKGLRTLENCTKIDYFIYNKHRFINICEYNK